uniref:Uncharacterized protein n=1 Tax=Kalanchoe fedtschenkoi TaxID=63787 RepID=A0A7N0R9J9_KALFE
MPLESQSNLFNILSSAVTPLASHAVRQSHRSSLQSSSHAAAQFFRCVYFVLSNHALSGVCSPHSLASQESTAARLRHHHQSTTPFAFFSPLSIFYHTHSWLLKNVIHQRMLYKVSQWR